MNNFRFYFIILFGLNFMPLCAQDEWQDDFAKNKLSYIHQDIFTKVSKTECFKEYPVLWDIMHCIHLQLHSENEDFIAFVFPLSPRTKKDSVRYTKLFPNLIYEFDKEQVFKAKNAIKIIYGEEAQKNWKNYVEYYPEEKVKNKFNGDTVTTYIFNLSEKNHYKDKYNTLKVIHIQKTGQGCISVYCLYDNKTKINEYIEAIENSFWFE